MAETKRRMRVGLYPGTFDPVTNGHIDVIARAPRPGFFGRMRLENLYSRELPKAPKE